MIFYQNSTTKRLEGFARNRGLNYGIVISPNNASGRYFIISIDNKPLTRWISLNWTVADAKQSIENQ